MVAGRGLGDQPGERCRHVVAGPADVVGDAPGIQGRLREECHGVQFGSGEEFGGAFGVHGLRHALCGACADVALGSG